MRNSKFWCSLVNQIFYLITNNFKLTYRHRITVKLKSFVNSTLETVETSNSWFISLKRIKYYEPKCMQWSGDAEN